VYASIFLAIGNYFWNKSNFKILGGLLVTVAVCMTPLIIYGVQKQFGWWPQGDPGSYKGYHLWVKGSWFYLEIGTILASALALTRFKFPFITMPAYFSLWYMTMDLTPLLFGKNDFTWEERKMVSMIFGLAILIFSYFIDLKKARSFAYWGYIFGGIAFWGGLTSMSSDNELSKFIYLSINIFLILTSVFLNRRIFLILGSIGCSVYLAHLFEKVFNDYFSFPIIISIVGLAIILLGVKYQKNEKKIKNFILKSIPRSFHKLRPTDN